MSNSQDKVVVNVSLERHSRLKKIKGLTGISVRRLTEDAIDRYLDELEGLTVTEIQQHHAQRDAGKP